MLKSFSDYTLYKQCFPCCDNSMGLLRNEMPQIDKSNVEDFLIYLDKFNIAYEEINYVSKEEIRNLKPCQIELNFDKVKHFSDKLKSDVLTPLQKFIVSQDGYLLDGHHRVAALNLNKSKDHNTCFVEVKCGIRELLSYANNFESINKEEDNKN